MTADGVPTRNGEDGALEPDLVDEAVDLRVRYESDPRIEYLDEAERIVRICIRECAERGEPAGYELAELAQVLRYRYAAGGDVEDLRVAVEAQRRSVAESIGEPAELFRRSLLAGILVEWHDAGNPKSLGEARRLSRAILHTMRREGRSTPGDGYRSKIYTTCSTVLGKWAEQHDDRKSIAEAADAARDAVAAADAADRPDALGTLADILWTAFQIRPDPKLLDESISVSEQALAALEDLEAPEATTEPDSALPAAQADRLGDLGIRLTHRSERTADPADAEAGVRRIRVALDLLPEGHADRGRHLTNFSIALGRLYELTKAETLLDQAVDAARAAVAGSIPDRRKALRLSNLAACLQRRYDHKGALADLDEGIDRLRDAIGIADFEVSHAAGVVMNLGSFLNDRYDRLGARGDLDEGIQVLREALALTRRSAAVPVALATLGSLLYDRFELDGDPADRFEAGRCFRKAISASHRADPDIAFPLSNYAILRREDGTRSGPRAAVRLTRRALRSVPPGSPLRPSLLSELALALCMRNRRGDLDRALAAIEQALSATPEDHANFVGFLTNLVYILDERRVDHRYPDPDAETLVRIASIARTAAMNRAGWPSLRVSAASLWGWLSGMRGAVEEAAEGYALAVQLVSELSPRRLVQTDAQRHLGSVAGLAGAAAETQLTAGQPELALGVLELGRGVLLNRVVGARADTAAVRGSHPELADRFETLRARLDGLRDDPVGAPMAPTMSTDAVGRVRALAVGSSERDHRRDLVQHFEQTIVAIREDPRHARFLRPPELSELLQASAESPVVLLNTGPDRSDALLLTPAGLRTIPLPDANADEAVRQALLLQEASERSTAGTVAALAEAQETVTRCLDWLWSAVAGPVVRALAECGMPKPVSDMPPRVWWVPTQSLCFLPLHAATDRATGESVLDHCVSSYTPTVTALLYARHRRRDPMPGPPEAGRCVVLTSSATADGAPRLPAAEREANAVARLLGATPLDLADAPEPALRAALATCSRLHVAMHAFADLDDPSRSRFSVAGVGLAFSELAALDNRAAQFAFLSACETAATRHNLADEAIHLSTALHLAGFPEVIGTQRRLPDLVAERAVALFYTELLRGPNSRSRLEPGAAAYALHRTALALRRRFRDQPSAWSAYHHMGV